MTNSRWRPGRVPALAGLWLLLAASLALGAAELKPMPAFPHNDAGPWLNSPPLHAADLRGKVVLIDLFTSG